MTKFTKIVAGTVAALTLTVGILATSTNEAQALGPSRVVVRPSASASLARSSVLPPTPPRRWLLRLRSGRLPLR